MTTQILFSQLIRTDRTVNGQFVWHTAVNQSVLRNMLSDVMSKDVQWVLNLPEEKAVIFRTAKIEKAGEQSCRWFGESPTSPNAEAYLTAHGLKRSFPALEGIIVYGALFYVRNIGDGMVSIYRGLHSATSGQIWIRQHSTKKCRGQYERIIVWKNTIYQ